MAIELKRIGEQSAELWKRLTPGRRVVFVLVAASVLGTSAYFGLRNETEPYALLMSDLRPEDAAAILEELKKGTVPYRITRNGSAIEVPESRVLELRISLSSAGLAGQGAGFELFDKQSYGTTAFAEKVQYKRALAGELVKTIEAIDGVERARVHLAIGEKALYAKDVEPPSASVIVKLERHRQLSSAQVRGIVQFVASSVEGLTSERVTMVDESGARLWSGEDGGTSDEQRDLEKELRQRVHNLIDPIAGEGRAVVVVTAELDSSSVETTEEIFQPGAVRGETSSEERNGATGANGGGVAGARGNLPGAPAGGAVAPAGTGGATAAADGFARLSSTRNYEVNRKVSHSKSPKQRIARLHVAVLLDGPASAAPLVATSSISGRTSSTAASSSTAVAAALPPAIAPAGPALEEIAALASTAAGLDKARGDRIEVRRIPFASKEPEHAPEAPKAGVLPELPIPVLAGAGAAILLLLLVAVAIAIRRSRKKKQATAEVVEMPILPITAREAATVIESGAASPTLALPESTARDRAVESIKADAEQAAAVIAAWLSEPVEAPAAAPRTRQGEARA